MTFRFVPQLDATKLQDHEQKSLKLSIWTTNLLFELYVEDATIPPVLLLNFSCLTTFLFLLTTRNNIKKVCFRKFIYKFISFYHPPWLAEAFHLLVMYFPVMFEVCKHRSPAWIWNSARQELGSDQRKQLKCKELKGFWNTSVLW